MLEYVTVPNAARLPERRSRGSPTDDASLVELAEHEPRVKPYFNRGGVSATNTSVSVSNTFQVVPAPSLGSAIDTQRWLFLSPREAQFLYEVARELAELEPALQAAAERCRQFVHGAGLGIGRAPQCRWAIFGDDEKAISLTVHSPATRRQVAFEFVPQVPSVSITRIDENMRRDVSNCATSDDATLSNAIAWLNPRC